LQTVADDFHNKAAFQHELLATARRNENVTFAYDKAHTHRLATNKINSQSRL